MQKAVIVGRAIETPESSDEQRIRNLNDCGYHIVASRKGVKVSVNENKFRLKFDNADHIEKTFDIVLTPVSECKE